MGQQQSRTKKKKKKALRPKESDNAYILAISNPAFLDWEHREERQAGLDQKKRETVAKLEAQHQQFPIQISEHIYLSNAVGVSDIESLKSLGITHVLNVGGPMAAWRRPEDYENAGIQYKLVDAIDEPTYAMLDHHLEECLDFIRLVPPSGGGSHKGESDDITGKCVVHCQAGCNRSGVIVASEHMLRTRSNVLETVLHCRKCRGNGFLTNPGFQGQLVALARRERLLGPTPGSSNCVVEPWIWRKIQKEITDS